MSLEWDRDYAPRWSVTEVNGAIESVRADFRCQICNGTHDWRDCPQNRPPREWGWWLLAGLVTGAWMAGAYVFAVGVRQVFFR